MKEESAADSRDAGRQAEGYSGKFRKYNSIFRNVTMVGQLGLSLIMPLLLCMFFCYYLTIHFHLGAWVYIPGVILGAGSSVMTAWKTYQTVVKKENEADTKEQGGPSFNRHF